MDYGKISRVTTFIVTGMLIFILAGFDGCGGLVSSGSGGRGSSINGTVVDASTKSPVAGALVVLEQPDGSGIDRVIASTTSASNGSFSFSPPSTGVFDVVVDALVTPASAPAVTYAATVTFGVLANANLNQIPLVPEFGTATPPTGDPATVFATVTTSGTTMGTTIAFLGEVDVKLSALQSVSPAVGSVNQVTIPVFARSTPIVTTMTAMTGASCPIGTTCANYTLVVPSGNFSFGTFSASGTQYTLSLQQPASVNYTVEGKAFSHGSGLFQECIPSSTSSVIGVSSGTVNSGNPNLTFTSCS